MPLINRLERKFGWIAVPGLVRAIMIFQVLVFVLVNLQASRELPDLLALDIDKVMRGELWRLVTFVFVPPTLRSVIGMFFAVFVTVLLARLLEELWGSFRMTLYVLGGVAGAVAGAFVYWAWGQGGGLQVNRYLFSGSLLFAAAVYHPNMEFRLFFVIPVKLSWIAIFGGAGLLLIMVSALGKDPALSAAALLSVANFLVVFGPGFRRALKMRGETAVRRRKFDTAKASAKGAMHECSACGKTEHDDRDLVFRVAPDGEEYCVDCRAKQKT